MTSPNTLQNLPAAPIFDPTSANPVQVRSYDVLRQNHSVHETAVSGDRDSTFAVREASPLAAIMVGEGKTIAMAAVIKTSGQEYQVWGSMSPTGKINGDVLMITHNDYDPLVPVTDPQPWYTSIYQTDKQAEKAPTMLSTSQDNDETLALQLTEAGLSISAQQTTEKVNVLSKQGEIETPDLGQSKVAGFAGARAVTAVVKPEHLTEQNFEPSFEKRYESVETDPAFISLVTPLRRKIDARSAPFELEIKQLEAELSHLSGRAHIDKTIELSGVRAKRHAATLELRRELKSIVTPYFQNKINLLRDGEVDAGYLMADQLAPTKIGSYQSKGGKLISYGGTGVLRLGQVILPEGSSWGFGDNHPVPQDRQYRSRDHVLDIASSLVSGADPYFNNQERVIVQRDKRTEGGLPNKLDRLALYKVVSGVNTVVARRLVDGLDGLVMAHERYDA